MELPVTTEILQSAQGLEAMYLKNNISEYDAIRKESVQNFLRSWLRAGGGGTAGVSCMIS